jgi:hypothetical protein
LRITEWAVGHRRLDLHATVDRPRVHDDGIGLGAGQARGGQAEQAVELAFARQQAAGHALALQAQHDHHVDVLQAFGHVGVDLHAVLLDADRQQGFRRDHADVRAAQGFQRQHVRARHPRVQDVADDGHREVFEAALVPADGEHVEHALGRVRVTAVAAVDDRHLRAHVLGDEVRGAGVAVAHDEHVGGHGFEVAQGVEQGFALAGRRGRHVQGDHVGRQALGRQFEGGAGAGGVLEEHVAHGLAAQQRDLLHRAGTDFEERVGGVEDFRQQFAGQTVEREEVAQLALIIELQRALGV